VEVVTDKILSERDTFPDDLMDDENNDAESQLLQSNIFSTLANTNADEKPELRKRRRVNDDSLKKHDKSHKPPPIVLLNVNVSKIQSDLKLLGITDFRLQLTSEGTKVLVNTTTDYNKVKNILIEKGTRFFTHQPRDEQLSKFVLSGLHKMTTEAVKDLLKNADKAPVRVVEMKIKDAKHKNHALYIVYYLKKDGVKLVDLQQIRTLSYMVVKWSYFQVKRTSPNPCTQCTRCQRFGHGALNCHAEPRCIRCSAEHLSADCPLIKGKDGNTLKKISPELLVCVHCSGQHTANFSGCRKRVEFVNSRLAASQQSKRRKPKQFGFAPAPQLTEAHFPSIPASSASSHNAWHHAPRHPPQQAPPLPQTQSTHQPPPHKRTPAPPSQPQQSNNNVTNDLFDNSQLITIFQEMTTQLAHCFSKHDQINALMTIALKYLAINNV
jgi:hypothetical protein